MEDQPLPVDASPTALSPGYIADSDEEEDEEDPADHLVDGGDNDDNESSDDDDDDDDVEKDEEDEEEEEHLAPADPSVETMTTVNQGMSVEEIERVVAQRVANAIEAIAIYETKTNIARKSMIQTERKEDKVAENASNKRKWKAVMIRLRAEAPSTSYSLQLPPPIILSHTRSDAPSSETPPLLPIPAPTSSPPLLLPSTNRREDRPEVTLPPRKRLGIALGPRYEVGESSSATTAKPTRGSRADYGFVATLDKEIRRDPERYVDYGITDTWDEMLEDMPAAPATDDTELGRWMTEFATRVRQDTDEIYMRLDDEQTKRQLMASQLNMLYRDRRAHARKGLLMEREARISRKAWG
ncbi:hypothetical protein Tco_0071959 [Tanacetum coccineum]